MSKLIKTAISGSLPKPAWLAEPEKLWAPWQLQGEALEQAKADAMRLAVDDQLRAGITVIGDGEQTRQHFVTTFIEHLSGVDFVNRTHGARDPCDLCSLTWRRQTDVATGVGAEISLKE